MATLSEVALLAGVTTATVSNVLRNPDKVKPSTAKRVKAAIAATGYRPNLMARALSEGKSSMVAIVLPNIINPYYPEFVRTAERVARQRKYFLMVCNTDEQAETGRAYIRQIAGTLADGVLVLHTGISTPEILELRGWKTLSDRPRFGRNHRIPRLDPARRRQLPTSRTDRRSTSARTGPPSNRRHRRPGLRRRAASSTGGIQGRAC